MSVLSNNHTWNRFLPDKLNPAVKEPTISRPSSLAKMASAFLLFMSAITAAQAEPNFDTGVRYYKQGNYRAAAQSFSKVENAASQPTVLYYEALCNQQMG